MSSWEEDKISFANLTTDGTLAEIAVTNGGEDDSITLDGANTTVYVIDTDSNDIDANSGDDEIADFTSMANVEAFLALVSLPQTRPVRLTSSSLTTAPTPMQLTSTGSQMQAVTLQSKPLSWS